MLSILIAGALMAEPWEPQKEVVESNRSRRPTFGWDESDVPKYTLPPVVDATTTAETWPARRQAIVELLETDMFGRPPVGLTSTVRISSASPAVGNQASHYTITITASHGAKSVVFLANVFVPANQKSAAPAFILIDHREMSGTEPPQDDANKGFWPVATLLERGYATAAFHCDPVAPDRKDAHDEGVHSLFDDLGPHGWSTLAAWAWAAGRVLDGLEQIEGVDSKRVGVIGHSRGGKTALWAGASDERFAIAVSNESGCGGAALSRRRIGETVQRINDTFPYWFNAKFKTYNERENAIPFDQHFVMSAIAPRAVYVGSADQDLWADPRGEYLSLVAANPVYALFGDDNLPETMTALDVQRIVGRRGYHVRSGKHNLRLEDWVRVLDFADSVYASSR